MIDEAAIGERFSALAGEFNERQRRLWAAAEARPAGRGGIEATAGATGIHQDTIRMGIRELESGERLPAGRVRRAGAGRKALADIDPTLLDDLRTLVEGDTPVILGHRCCGRPKESVRLPSLCVSRVIR